MEVNNEANKTKWWQFSMAGLFMVVTILCVRLAFEGHHSRYKHAVEVTVRNGAPVSPRRDTDDSPPTHHASSVNVRGVSHPHENHGPRNR